jgi:hypothetical protein
MKHFLLTALSLALFTGCHKKEDPAPDPFLGHWQAESYSYVVVDTKGQATGPTQTAASAIALEVAATTMQFTYGTGSAAKADAPIHYTRNGEVLTSDSPTKATQGFFARSLTATSFVFEQTDTRSDGSVFIIRTPFHR